MCTVSFIPYNGNVFLTSNRDEQTLREPATHPFARTFGSGKILFPEDGRAGGTWIGLHQNGNAMVLLNGAFERHIPEPPYRKSRGLVFLDIFDSDDPETQFANADLDGIEPFTLVLFRSSKNTLWEMRWDGRDKSAAGLSALQPAIWSSVTLYDKEVIAKREHWFSRWLKETQIITSEKVRAFHEFGGEGNEWTDLKMNRNGILRTVSITGMELSPERSAMYYKDTVAGKESVTEWLRVPGILEV